jgi:Domain of unknown function (DUF4340)
MATAYSRRGVIAGMSVLVLVAGAYWVATRDRSDKLVSALLYPDLSAQLQSAERLQLFTAGEQLAVEVVREGERWSVTQRADYPADKARIGALLQNLAELRIIEAKTADATRYADLGLEDVSASNAQGLHLVVSAAGNASLVNLIVGKGSSGMEATYVRKAGEASTWLVSHLELNRTPGAWLSSAVMHIDTERIQQVTIRRSGDPGIVLTKPDRNARDFAAAGKTLATPAAANGIAAALIAVEAQDVRRTESLGAQPPAARASYRMFDGLELELTGWMADNGRWITVAPSFNADLAERFAQDKPGDNTGQASGPTPEQVRQQAERLKMRLDGWAFRIPDYKYDGIFPDAEIWLKP